MTQAEIRVPLPQRSFLETRRRDVWWVQPIVVFLGFSAFIVYSTWAAFQNAHYTFEGYLSPFYSPLLFGGEGHHQALFGPKPGWWPAIIPFSPALLILWAPGGFRFTCYYYRGAYYKAFWLSPANCTVGKPLKGYRGEKKFPLVMQNIHRYFLYLALAFLVILSIDVYKGMWFDDGAGGRRLGIGVGTLVLLINVCLLSGYTLGCHSLRHLIGGRKDCPSKSVAGGRAYDCVSCLNRRHMLFAWLSLFWVGFTDVYVRMCSMGYFTDYRILF